MVCGVCGLEDEVSGWCVWMSGLAVPSGCIDPAKACGKEGGGGFGVLVGLGWAASSLTQSLTRLTFLRSCFSCPRSGFCHALLGRHRVSMSVGFLWGHFVMREEKGATIVDAIGRLR